MDLRDYSPCQWRMLVLTLKALKDAVKTNTSFLDEVLKNGDPTLRERFINNDLPYPFFMHVEGESTILQKLSGVQKLEESPSSRLYIGTMNSGRVVLVKFSLEYGDEVHKAWADAGFAPAVYLSKMFPGGFRVTAMEWLSDEEGWSNMTELDGTTRAAVLPVVEESLAKAHSIKIGANGEGGVLGDCRDQNIMIQFRTALASERDPKTGADVLAVKFIDYDWAGIEGSVRYPPLMSKGVAWPEGAEIGQLIRQSHDRKLLASNT